MWLLILACVLVPAIAVLLSARGDVDYEVEARVTIDQADVSSQLLSQSATLTQEQQTQLLTREAELAESGSVLERAKTLARPTLGSATLEDVAKVEVAGDTGLLLFIAERPVPGDAAAIADAYASAYLEERRNLDAAQYRAAIDQLTDKLATLDTPVEQATSLYESLSRQRDELEARQALVSGGGTLLGLSEPEQVGLTPLGTAVVGISLGLVVGLLLAFVVEALDRRPSSVEHIDDAIALPLLGEVPDVRSRRRPGGLFVMRDAPLTPTAEAFRSLRAGVELAVAHHTVPTLMVTSATESEGKTVTACNLAAAFALSGCFVTLVDFDLRRPNAHVVMGLDATPGVSEIASGRTSIADATIRVDLSQAAGEDLGRRPAQATGEPRHLERGGMYFVPTGDVPANVGDFIGMLDVRPLLDALGKASDMVIIDAPPILGGGDGLVLSSFVSAVLVVTRLGVTERRHIDDVQRKLALSHSEVIGYVVTAANKDPAHPDAHYGVNGRVERSPRMLPR